jgi:predicted TIM-barrel fold metal-dependent hydrolase
MRDGLRVFDADGHVIEPTDLWWSYLDPKFRADVVPDTARLGEKHGRLMPIAGGHATFQGSPMMTEYLSRDTDTVGDMQLQRFGRVAERGFEPGALLEALDIEGIDQAAVYPSFGLHVPYCRHLEPPLATALARAYNRWIGEYARSAGGRVHPVGLAPLHDPALAAAEIERAVREDGVCAVMLRPNPLRGRPIHHPDNDPVFARIESLGIAAIIHEGRGGNVNFTSEDRFDSWYATRAACHPMEAMLAFAGFVTEGVFDRHPRMRVGFLESGSGWVPFWLDRMDEHHEMWAAAERPQLELEPSEYFARQCAISGETDDHFMDQVVDTVGPEHVIWASDFPHMECKYPESLKLFLEHTRMERSALQKVLWDTPCWLYGVDPAVRTAEGFEHG